MDAINETIHEELTWRKLGCFGLIILAIIIIMLLKGR